MGVFLFLIIGVGVSAMGFGSMGAGNLGVIGIRSAILCLIWNVVILCKARWELVCVMCTTASSDMCNDVVTCGKS